jgi:hypothetical protein
VSETLVKFGNLYLGNKMTGVAFFNAPWFDKTAEALMRVPGVDFVFNPAEHDRQLGLDPMRCPNGSPEEAIAQGLPSGKALADDWAWIVGNSSGLVIGPDWAKSKGTISEIACHQALGLPVWESRVFLRKAEAGCCMDELFRPDLGYLFPPLGVYLV